MKTQLPEYLQSRVGKKLGTSAWLKIDQERINLFAKATNDPDPMHINPDWCKKHSPFGRPIAFGFLTLSLLTSMHHEVLGYALEDRLDENYGLSYGLNYGFDHLRFIEPVLVNSRIRGHFLVQDIIQRRPDEFLMKIEAKIEIEGYDRPALVAKWLAMLVEQQGHRRLAGNVSDDDD